MKTNVSIEIENSDLVILANLIDGKETKRTAKRAEIVELCQRFIEGMIEKAKQEQEPEPEIVSVIQPERRTRSENPLHVIDLEDRELLEGRSLGYVIGWNKVKRGKKF